MARQALTGSVIIMGFSVMRPTGQASGVKRRSATPYVFDNRIRGLKPTAIITASLRDGVTSAAERQLIVAPPWRAGLNDEKAMMVAPSFEAMSRKQKRILVAGRRWKTNITWSDAAERQLMVAPPFKTGSSDTKAIFVAERRLKPQTQLEKGCSMSRTYTCLHYHCVFSTKNRERLLRPEIESRVWPYLGGIARENKMISVRIGGFADHLHLLISIPPVLSISKAMQLIKGGSTKWIKDTFPDMRGFSWQDGYSAFTVSKSQLPEIDRYIQNQPEHHRIKSFQEEYRAFLERHDIAYDERYLWD